MQSRADALIRQELEPGERLLWSGRPGSIIDRQKLAESLVLCGPWLFIGIFIAACARQDGQSGGAIIAFVLCAIGIAFALGDLFSIPLQQVHQHYGLTNRRIIILHSLFERTIESFRLQSMQPPNLLVSSRRNRHGTIEFTDFARPCDDDPAEICAPKFVSVPEARHIADLIIQACAAAGTSGPQRLRPREMPVPLETPALAAGPGLITVRVAVTYFAALAIQFASWFVITTFDEDYRRASQVVEYGEPRDSVFLWMARSNAAVWVFLVAAGSTALSGCPWLVRRGLFLSAALPCAWLLMWVIVFRPHS